MKEMKLLNRVQEEGYLHFILILAMIREYNLKSELTCFIHPNNIHQLVFQLIMQF